jgi:hypothetical protein
MQLPAMRKKTWTWLAVSTAAERHRLNYQGNFAWAHVGAVKVTVATVERVG